MSNLTNFDIKVIHSNEQDEKRDRDRKRGRERENLTNVVFVESYYYHRQRRMRKLETEQIRKIVCFRVDYGVIE